MNSTIRIILAVLVGLLIGSMVNMGIVMISGLIIPPPEGADTTTMEGLKNPFIYLSPGIISCPFWPMQLGHL